MVYLLQMVIFHGYVRHNQMAFISLFHFDTPKRAIQDWRSRFASGRETPMWLANVSNNNPVG